MKTPTGLKISARSYPLYLKDSKSIEETSTKCSELLNKNSLDNKNLFKSITKNQPISNLKPSFHPLLIKNKSNPLNLWNL